MTLLLDAARQIHAQLPTMGGQQLADAERDLTNLRMACHVLSRRNMTKDHAVQESSIMHGMLGDIEIRREAWAEELTALIAEKYPTTNLSYMEGADATDQLMQIEMKLIGTAGHVMVSIDGVETSVPGENVLLIGYRLTIEDTRGRMVLELNLDDVAGFGFASGTGFEEEWTGFDVLTLDGRHISLR